MSAQEGKKKETLSQKIMNASKTKLSLEEERELYKQKLAKVMKTAQFPKVHFI